MRFTGLIGSESEEIDLMRLLALSYAVFLCVLVICTSCGNSRSHEQSPSSNAHEAIHKPLAIEEEPTSHELLPTQDVQNAQPQKPPLSAEAFIAAAIRKAKRRDPDREGALKDLNSAVQANPHYIRAYLFRGGHYDTVGNHAKAIEDYTSALDIDPNHRQAYLWRAWSRRHLNDMLGYNEDMSRHSLICAEEHRQRADYAKAIKFCEEAMSLTPKSPDPYRLRAQIRSILGDKEGASADRSMHQQLLRK